MLDDYKKAVILDYHQKKVKGSLSSNMLKPTCKSLKEECLVVLGSRTEKKDEKVLREFFNYGTESNDYSDSISRFDRDRFKPLDNFLSGETDVRDFKNVEILAWLIGFEPRPYKFEVVYGKTDSIEEEGETKPPPSEKNEHPLDPQKKQDETTKQQDRKWPVRISSRKAIPMAAVFLLLTAGTSVYIYWESTKVYICGSRTADRYHINHNCPMLENCKNGKTDVISITEAEAKESGKTLCKFEH